MDLLQTWYKKMAQEGARLRAPGPPRATAGAPGRALPLIPPLRALGRSYKMHTTEKLWATESITGASGASEQSGAQKSSLPLAPSV